MAETPQRPGAQNSYWLVAFGLLIGLIATGLILLLGQPRRGEPVALLPPPTAAPILVHVSGAVQSPGLYQLDLGNRAQDAIQAAGGHLEDADLERINLARVLVDGQQVHLPFLGEAEAPISFPMNINRANAEQLALLPGIGPITAEAIVQHRDTHGPFETIEDIQDVSGIGPSTFETLKALIDIEG